MIHCEFPNGVFGDPALFLDFEQFACLVDCGDLSRFTQKQLLKVNAVFVSHCHMDHFMDFDRLLRAHMGSEKSIEVFGPPGMISKLSGKLQAYTWNLMEQSQLEFRVTELDFQNQKKRRSTLRASQEFQAAPLEDAPLENSVFFLSSREGVSYGPEIRGCELDHRTPSLAYRFTERRRHRVNSELLKEINIKAGPWIGQILGRGDPHDREWIEVEGQQILSKDLFQKENPFTVVYITDGAAHSDNYKKLLVLCKGCDVLFAESCFLKAETEQATRTKHFIAPFIAKLATEAGVDTLAPFHFSKRYQRDVSKVYAELSQGYQGTILKL